MRKIKKPTVLVDGVVFENTLQNGVWRVFYEVMERTSDQIDYVLILGGPQKREIPCNVKVIKRPRRFGPRRLRYIRKLQQRSFDRMLQKKFAGAIWHSSFYTIDPRPKPRSVVTVHDLIAEEHCWDFPVLRNQIAAKSDCLRQANAVLAVSVSTLKSTCVFYPTSSSKISLVYNGADHFQAKVSRSQTPHKCVDYVLFVGDRIGYKNFKLLVDATLTPNWPLNLIVRVVGSPFSVEELAHLRSRNRLAYFENIGRVTDQELGSLYSEALCFVFPSKAEGFGMPAIESQLSGTPAVLSDIPVFREICGESAVYFSPNDPSNLANSVRYAIDERAELIKRGLENSSRYTWSSTADKMVDIYERVSER